MMMILQNQDKFDEVAEIPSVSGAVQIVSKSRNEHLQSLRTCGVYSALDGNFVALFQANGSLWIRVNDSVYKVENDVSARWNESPDANTLIVEKSQHPLFRLSYKPRVIDPPLALDRTPFVEREQFDLGLFIFNALNNPDRRRLLKDEAWRS